MIILDNSKIIDQARALLSGGCKSCHYNVLSDDMKEIFCSNIDNVREHPLFKRKKKADQNIDPSDYVVPTGCNYCFRYKEKNTEEL